MKKSKESNKGKGGKGMDKGMGKGMGKGMRRERRY
jgi:hypothetical protein